MRYIGVKNASFSDRLTVNTHTGKNNTAHADRVLVHFRELLSISLLLLLLHVFQRHDEFHFLAYFRPTIRNKPYH